MVVRGDAVKVRIKNQFDAVIHLDAVDSSGALCGSINFSHARLMALSVREKDLWYGFVITESRADTLNPNESAVVTIAFFNELGARSVFPLNASILFGDGINSRGFIVLTDHRLVDWQETMS